MNAIDIQYSATETNLQLNLFSILLLGSFKREKDKKKRKSKVPTLNI